MVYFKCLICNKEFQDVPSTKRKFCSRECFYIYLGRKLRNGKTIKCDYCKKAIYRSLWELNRNKNNFCSRSCKAKYRADKLRGKLIPMLSGKNHWNWKGGITPERTKIWHSKKYQEWRTTVYKRDNYTCQKCGDCSGGNLIPHHKDNFADYPKKRFKLNNGITLCNNCHTYFHSKYGTHHNQKEQLREFLNEKQENITTSRGNIASINNA